MSRHSQLFTISIEHQFFAEGSGPSLEFVPASDTALFIQRMGLLLRSTPRSLEAFQDEDRREAMALETSRPDEPVELLFKVFTRDQSFKNYTHPAVQRHSEILFFENRVRTANRDGGVLLHDGDWVSDEDFLGIDDLARIPGLLTGRDMVVHPDFILRILLRNDDSSGKSYRVRFEARQTIWKYYLLGHARKEVPGITDLNNQTEFEFTGKSSLPDDRTALTFRSKTPIALREKYDFRFQLRDKSASGEKVLIRRLPVASASQFGKEVIDGRETIVSEIYINS